eukprot:scaffold5941_cov125-Isochrysis_galbana.AAC.3
MRAVACVILCSVCVRSGRAALVHNHNSSKSTASVQEKQKPTPACRRQYLKARHNDSLIAASSNTPRTPHRHPHTLSSCGR